MTYNPFFKIWDFSLMYGKIIADELTNDNAMAFYADGWDAHQESMDSLKELYLDRWAFHTEAVLVAAAMVYEVLTDAVDQVNTPRLKPCPIAGVLPPADEAITLDFSWINWKAYLFIVLGLRRVY